MPERVQRYWRNAQKCFEVAKTFTDFDAKRIMLVTADQWLMMAAQRVKAVTITNEPSGHQLTEQMRALAETINDVEARMIMLRLADDYDKLTDRAEARAKPETQ